MLSPHAQLTATSILESSTDSVFLHVTTNTAVNKEWGSIFKSVLAAHQTTRAIAETR